MSTHCLLLIIWLSKCSHICCVLFVADLQKKGVHLYQTCPSGNYFEYKAIAIGARSQSARTYLEKHFESFDNCECGLLMVFVAIMSFTDL